MLDKSDDGAFRVRTGGVAAVDAPRSGRLRLREPGPVVSRSTGGGTARVRRHHCTGREKFFADHFRRDAKPAGQGDAGKWRTEGPRAWNPGEWNLARHRRRSGADGKIRADRGFPDRIRQDERGNFGPAGIARNRLSVGNHTAARPGEGRALVGRLAADDCRRLWAFLLTAALSLVDSVGHDLFSAGETVRIFCRSRSLLGRGVAGLRGRPGSRGGGGGGGGAPRTPR